MHILVVGAGSIGQRHIKNLVELGVEGITVYDPNRDRRIKAIANGSNVVGVKELETAFRNSPDAAIVAVPTYLHMEVARQLVSRNMPLFIEKPVFHNLDYTAGFQAELEHFNQWAVIGYSMRFHPAIQIIKDLLPQIGTPLYARAEVGQYLPDWHPEEDYRNWYMAHEDQGGGALLDLSHEIDYMRWLFGENKSLIGCVVKHPHDELDMDADTVADMLIQFDKTAASIHMDLLDRSYNRRLRIVGSEGTISWEDDGIVRLLDGSSFDGHYYQQNRNEQFREEMAAFVDSVQCGIPHPTLATLEDGIEVLKVVLELKKQNGRG